VVQSQLRQVGVDAQVRSLEFQTLLTQHRARDFDAVLQTWVLDNFQVASAPAALFHSRWADVPRSANRSSFANPRADSLIDAGAAETDPERAREIWAAFTELLNQEQPFTFMFWLDELAGVSRTLGGVVMDPRGELVSIADWHVPCSPAPADLRPPGVLACSTADGHLPPQATAWRDPAAAGRRHAHLHRPEPRARRPDGAVLQRRSIARGDRAAPPHVRPGPAPPRPLPRLAARVRHRRLRRLARAGPARTGHHPGRAAQHDDPHGDLARPGVPAGGDDRRLPGRAPARAGRPGAQRRRVVLL